MIRRPAAVAAVLATAGLCACRAAEPPEAAHARAKKTLYEKQIQGLQETLARFRQAPPSKRRLLVAVDEEVFGEVVGATLPLQVPIKDRLSLRLEKASAYFRYTQGVVMFEGRLAGIQRPDRFLSMRLAGGIDDVSFKDGSLSAHVKLYYFEVLGSGLGDMGRSVIEQLVRDNLALVEDAIPPIVIPVRLEQAIALPGLGEGPVSVEPGTLPLSVAVAQTLSLDGRLWISIDVDAGPWKRGGGKTPPPAEGGKAGSAPAGGKSPSPAPPGKARP